MKFTSSIEFNRNRIRNYNLCHNQAISQVTTLNSIDKLQVLNILHCQFKLKASFHLKAKKKLLSYFCLSNLLQNPKHGPLILTRYATGVFKVSFCLNMDMILPDLSSHYY